MCSLIDHLIRCRRCIISTLKHKALVTIFLSICIRLRLVQTKINKTILNAFDWRPHELQLNRIHQTEEKIRHLKSRILFQQLQIMWKVLKRLFFCASIYIGLKRFTFFTIFLQLFSPSCYLSLSPPPSPLWASPSESFYRPLSLPLSLGFCLLVFLYALSLAPYLALSFSLCAIPFMFCQLFLAVLLHFTFKLFDLNFYHRQITHSLHTINIPPFSASRFFLLLTISV